MDESKNRMDEPPDLSLLANLEVPADIFSELITLAKEEPKHMDIQQEMHVFLCSFGFITELVCEQLRPRCYGLEDEMGSYLDCLTALISLENALIGSNVQISNLDKDIIDAAYDLAKIFEPLFHHRPIKGMLATPFAEVEMADEHSHWYYRALKDVRTRIRRHWHIDRKELISQWTDRHKSPLNFPVLQDVRTLVRRGWALGRYKNPIIKDLSLDDRRGIISRSRTLDVLLQGKHNLPQLPNCYWDSDRLLNFSFLASKIMDRLMGNPFGTNIRLLLLTGDPGSGKTSTILSATRLLLRGRNKHEPYYQVVAHFCDHGDTVEDSILSVGRQFLKNDPNGLYIFDNEPNFERKYEMIDDLIWRRQYDPTVIIIDGIDECCGLNGDKADPDLATLFKFISSTLRSPLIRWIVSARSVNEELLADEAIRDRFQLRDLNDGYDSKEQSKGLASLEIDTLMGETSIDNRLWMDVEKSVVVKSKGNLLWIKLACIILEKDPKNRTDVMKSLGDKVEDLFALGYEKLMSTTRDDGLSKKILAITAAAYRPLAISSLRSLVMVPDNVNLRKIIMSQFSLFLEIRDDVVHFTHHEARRFIIEKLPKVASEAHANMALQCMTALRVGPDVVTSLPICYAASNWIKHLLLSQFTSDEIHTKHIALDTSLVDFLNYGFIEWLDAKHGTLYPASGDSTKDLLRLRDSLAGFTNENNSLHGHIAHVIDAVRFHRFHASQGTVSPQQSFIFYPFNKIRPKLLKEVFPQLLNIPAMQFNLNDMVLNLRQVKEVNCCAYSPDGRFVASSSKDRKVCIWDANNGVLINTIIVPDGGPRYITISVSGALAILSDTDMIDIWDIFTCTRITAIFTGEEQRMYWENKLQDFAFSPDGKELAIATQTSIWIWTLPESKKRLPLVIPHRGTIIGLRLLGDGLIAFSSSDVIYIWCSNTKCFVHELLGHTGDVISLAFSSERQWLASGSTDKTIRVWDAKLGKLLHTLKGHESGVTCISFSFDGAKLASASGPRDKTIKIWDLENENSDPLNLTMNESEEIMSVQFSPKDFSLASALRRGEEGSVRIWDTYALQQEVNHSVTQPGGHTSAVDYLKFSHNGKFIASASYDGKICIWDGETGQHQASLEGQSRGPGWLSISLDDRSLISSSDDSTVMIWNTATWSLKQKLIGHQRRVSCAVFSADGKRIASVSDDNTIRVWESHTATNDDEIKETKETFRFGIGKQEEEVSMAFSSDGTHLACAMNAGRIIRVWDLKSETPKGHSANFSIIGPETSYFPHTIVFSPDGKFIIASGTDHLSLWDIQSKQRIRTILHVPTLFRSLTLNGNHPRYIFTEAGPYFIGDSFNIAATSGGEEQPVCIDGRQLTLSSGPELEPRSYKLRPDGSGILWDDNDWIKFPEEHRPLVHSFHGTKIAMGYKSGLVTLFNFAEDKDTEA